LVCSEAQKPEEIKHLKPEEVEDLKLEVVKFLRIVAAGTQPLRERLVVGGAALCLVEMLTNKPADAIAEEAVKAVGK
jgi:hypothetical protein